MNRVFTLASSLQKTSVRQLSLTPRNCKSNLENIKKKQALFQVDNDVPVYLKGGTMDYILYYTTIGLLVVGMASAFHATYKLCNKK